MKNNVNRELNDIARDFQASQMRANEIYNAIGRAYFDKTKSNPEPEFNQLFSDLEAVLRQQEQMEIRRKFLNGIVVCTNCKTDNNVELSFCGNCGTRLPHKMAPVEDGRIRCANCGNIMQPGQAFCGNCGTKAHESDSIPPVAAPVAEPVVQVAEPAVQVAEPAVQIAEEAVPAVEAPVTEIPAMAETAVAEEAVVIEKPEPVMAAVSEEAPTAEPKVNEGPVEEFYSSPEEFKMFCGNCGTMITNSEAAFCPNCGNRLSK